MRKGFVFSEGFKILAFLTLDQINFPRKKAILFLRIPNRTRFYEKKLANYRNLWRFFIHQSRFESNDSLENSNAKNELSKIVPFRDRFDSTEKFSCFPMTSLQLNFQSSVDYCENAQKKISRVAIWKFRLRVIGPDESFSVFRVLKRFLRRGERAKENGNGLENCELSQEEDDLFKRMEFRRRLLFPDRRDYLMNFI